MPDLDLDILKEELGKVLAKHGLGVQCLRAASHRHMSNSQFFDTHDDLYDLMMERIEDLVMLGAPAEAVARIIGDHEVDEGVVPELLPGDVRYELESALDEFCSTHHGLEEDVFEGLSLGDIRNLDIDGVDGLVDKLVELVENYDYDPEDEDDQETLAKAFGVDWNDELNAANDEEMENLPYWTIYWEPCGTFDPDVAIRCGLTPFEFHSDHRDYSLLALGACGMDLSPMLDAYQALVGGSVDPSSKFCHHALVDHDYARGLVGEEVFNEVMQRIAISPTITISTEPLSNPEEVEPAAPGM